jgi:geranylgeranyl pyrophosphate synthase
VPGGSLPHAFPIDDLDARLATVERRIEDVLDAGDAAALTAACRRVGASGGKLLRPMLTIVAAALGDVWDERVVSAAAAVELVQVGSLVHDDVFDRAATRRGVPTINAVEGEPLALVAGDFLLARAGAEAARAGGRAAEAVAAAVDALCVGQVREMHTTFDVDRDVNAYTQSVHGKTAALFACACRLGAICADLPADEEDALAAFGEQFGLAFQVLDDVLDVVGDADLMGKPVGSDLAGGVYTLPILFALQSDAGGDLAPLLRRRDGNDLAAALELVRGSGGTRHALGVVRDLDDVAARTLDALDDRPLTNALRAFPNAYLAWSLETFVRPASAIDAG